MAHEVESAFYAGNRPAWHGLGRVIEEEGVHADRALELAGLDWQVDTTDIEWLSTPIRDLGMKLNRFTYRTSDDKLLGMVGKDYKCLQNEEMFKFVDGLIDSGEAHWYTAGSLEEGKKVWGLLKLNEDILVGGLPDEAMERYIVLMSSHDGSMAMRVAPTTIRVVCKNTFNAAIAGMANWYSLKHTANAELSIGEARKALELTFKMSENLLLLGDTLLKKTVSESQFENMLSFAMPLPEPTGDVKKDDRVMVKHNEKEDKYFNTWRESPNLENVRGTAWGALNAVIEFDDHHTEYSRRGDTPVREKRMMGILGGHSTVEKAAEYLVAL